MVLTPRSQQLPSTVLVTNRSQTFITLQGQGSGVTDILFHYPNQVGTTASSPKVYPFTILVSSPGTKVSRCTVTNAYNFLDIEVGRTMAQDLFIGAYRIGINIDHAGDHVTLRNIVNSVFWDIFPNAALPNNDSILGCCATTTPRQLVAPTSLEIHDYFVFSRFAGYRTVYRFVP